MYKVIVVMILFLILNVISPTAWAEQSAEWTARLVIQNGTCSIIYSGKVGYCDSVMIWPEIRIIKDSVYLSITTDVYTKEDRINPVTNLRFLANASSGPLGDNMEVNKVILEKGGVDRTFPATGRCSIDKPRKNFLCNAVDKSGMTYRIAATGDLQVKH